ncbi:MAG: hypothetical protein ACWGQW_05980, partial [bacterium]
GEAGSETPPGEGGEEEVPPEAETPPEGGEETPPDAGEEETPLSLEEQNKQLLAKIEELSGRLKQPTEETPQAETPPPEEPPVVKKKELEAQQFLGADDDIDEILDSREKLNALLNKVFTSAVEYVQTSVGAPESLTAQINNMPRTIMTQIHFQTQMQNAVNAFYQEHPQLASVKQFVGATADEVQREHKDWSVEQIFTETAERSYKALGLKKKAVKVKAKDKEGGDAAFAQGSNNRLPVGNQGGTVADEIDELMDL